MRTDFIKTREDIAELARWLNSQVQQGKQVQVAASDKTLKAEETTLEGITKPQRGATHVYFRMMSKALNDAGYDMKKTLKEEVEIPWDADRGERFKESIWKPVCEAMFGVGSSEDLEPAQVSEVYKVVDRHLSQRTGVHVEFPTRFGNG